MNVIWKYELSLTTYNVIDLPVGAEILTVQVQHGAPVMWARVDPEQPKEKRTIGLTTTGGASTGGRYLATTQHDNGHLVLHWFDLTGEG